MGKWQMLLVEVSLSLSGVRLFLVTREAGAELCDIAWEGKEWGCRDVGPGGVTGGCVGRRGSPGVGEKPHMSPIVSEGTGWWDMQTIAIAALIFIRES